MAQLGLSKQGTMQVEQQSPNNTSLFSRKWIIGVAVVVLLIAAVAATGTAYIWFSGGSGEASTKTAAPVLIREVGDTRTLFRIVPEESEARFLIDEMLLGSPKTVVGVTDEIAGELLVDFDRPAQSELGTIRINVRTLETDNEFRNRALRGQILQADQPEFEFAEFTPTELLNLPDEVVIGTPIEFQVTGNLTVHGVTHELTFDTILTPVSKSRFEGTAETTVLYRDFGISIPEAAGVANVSDEVKLEIELVALALNE